MKLLLAVFIFIYCRTSYGNPLIIQTMPPKLTRQANKTMSTLELPSNATAIRADISDNFSCEGKSYGYYADVDNECQIFHVCLPVEYPDGKARNFRWSFICPEETVFNQEMFTCVRTEDSSIECKDSEMYYQLNKNFGEIIMENESSEGTSEEMQTIDDKQSSESEAEKFVHFDLSYHSQLQPEKEKQPITHQAFTMDLDHAKKIEKPITENKFPTYFVHEYIDDNKPNIFLPLKLNLEQEMMKINEQSNQKPDGSMEMISDMPEKFIMDIPTMPMTNEMMMNHPESQISEMESTMDAEKNLERRHVRRRKTQPKRRLLFQADSPK